MNISVFGGGFPILKDSRKYSEVKHLKRARRKKSIHSVETIEMANNKLAEMRLANQMGLQL